MVLTKQERKVCGTIPITTRHQDRVVDKKEDKTGPVVTKIGNLTADPDLRYSERGTPYCRVRIAVSSPVKTGDWARERKTDCYDVTAFGSLAENAAKSLAQGARIIVSGKGEVRNWRDEDGNERTGKAILADGLGPDLRWAAAAIERAEATSRRSQASRT